MNSLTNILKEVLNDAQKKALARAFVDRVHQIINNYTGNKNSKQIMVHGLGDDTVIEINLGNIDIVMSHKYNSTHAKFIPNTSNKKLPQIIVYNAIIDLKDKSLIINFDVKALYDEFVHFLDQRDSKNVNEASLQNDAQKSQRARSYIKTINDLISNYKRDTDEIKVKGLGQLSYIEISLEGITINILSKNEGNVYASFFPNNGKPYIDVYSAKIEREPNLKVKYNEQDLYHELIHFMDFSGAKTSGSTLVKNKNKSVEKKGFAGYINDPLEVNAHFFEFFMPNIMRIIEKEKQIPVTFNDFKNDVLQDSKTKKFIDDLDDKNKKKIWKRLGTYYTEILKNPDFKIQTAGGIDDVRLKKATGGFISKLKNLFKAA